MSGGQPVESQGLCEDGTANTCTHMSATGIDTTPIGPGKVWRCDHCGLTYRDEGDGKQASTLTPPTPHGKAWEDRLNIICLCGKVCSAVVRKNPAGGFIGHPGSDTYVDPPAAQVFANHLWEMNHPRTPPGASA